LLEDGVWIQFPQPAADQAANQYRTGDYWLIPARTSTGNVEWPQTQDSQGNSIAAAVQPHGVAHKYAPLAIVTVDASGTTSLESDCRHTWVSLL
jgi:hypothetical protein